MGFNDRLNPSKKPLTIMGPLTVVENLPENFLVMNSDLLSDLNFDSFYNKPIQSDAIFTICSHGRQEKIDYGLLHHDENHF